MPRRVLRLALGGVRVHTHSASAEAADAVQAKAYTIGQDIHFGRGHWSPETTAGQTLIAHEVAHTVQQAGHAAVDGPQFQLEVSSPQDAAEVEADAAGLAMVEGRPTTVTRLAAGTAQRMVLQREANTTPQRGDRDAGQAAPAAGGAGAEAVDPSVEAAEGPVNAGDLKTTGDPLDLEGNAWRFRFANPVVQDCLRYLITGWAGESNLDELLVAPYGEDPKWVQVVRYKVLQAAEKPGVENRTAAVAGTMCDAVEKHGPIKDPNDPRLSKVHQDTLEQARKRMGTSHAKPLSAEEKAQGRIDLFESKATKDGRVSKSGGTSCGLLPGTVMKNAGIMPDIKAVKGEPARLTGPAVMGMRDEG